MRATISDNARSRLSSNEITRIEEIFLDAKARISLFSVTSYKIEGNLETIHNIRASELFLLRTCASTSLILISVVPTWWQNCISRHKILCSETARKKPLVFERVMLLNVRRGDLDISAWFGVVNKVAVKKRFRTSFITCFASGMGSSSHKGTLRNGRPVYIRAIERERKNHRAQSSRLTY